MVGGGLNLHGIVSGAVGTVNSNITVAYEKSTGNTPLPSGKLVPSYAAVQQIRAQMQALTWKDLQQLDGINMNGERRAIYLYGAINGVVRPAASGGDLITDGDGNIWLVVQNLEQWPFWCKVAVTLQNQGS